MSCNCQEVAEKGKKDIENSLKIPFAVYESAMAQIMRLIWVIVLLIVLLVGTNAGWLIYESQSETVEETTTETTVTQDNAEGYNNYIGNDGDIVNGKADNNN